MTDRPDPAPRGSVPLALAMIVVIALILIGWALKATAVVSLPVVVSLLLSLAIMPVRDWVRARVPARLRWLGLVAAFLVMMAVIGAFVGALGLAARQLVAEVPVSMETLTAQIGGGSATPTTTAVTPDTPADAAAIEEGATSDANDEALREGSPEDVLRALSERALGVAAGLAGRVLNSALSAVAGIGIIVILTMLILAESEEWRRKARTVAGFWQAREMAASADTIASKVRAYLFLQIVIGAVSALLYLAWLSWWGTGLVFVFAMVVFLMNFIPNVGSIIGGSLPVLYVLMTKDWQTALWVGAGILVIEQVMGGIVQPRFQGKNIALSSLVIVVALLFWGWVWGIAGALIAVPLTAALVVIGARIPALEPYALMLSNQTSMGGLKAATETPPTS